MDKIFSIKLLIKKIVSEEVWQTKSYLKKPMWANIRHNVQQLTNIQYSTKMYNRRPILSHSGSLHPFQKGKLKSCHTKRRPLDNSEGKRGVGSKGGKWSWKYYRGGLLTLDMSEIIANYCYCNKYDFLYFISIFCTLCQLWIQYYLIW